MLNFLKLLFGSPKSTLWVKCPKCGHRPLKRQRRTGPIVSGRDPFFVWFCPKCGQAVDCPIQVLIK